MLIKTSSNEETYYCEHCKKVHVKGNCPCEDKDTVEHKESEGSDSKSINKEV